MSIHGDPVHEHDPAVIVREARENGKVGPNIAIKIPCTQAGLAATRKMYQILRDRRWPAIIIGGGARHLRHFTEMVGGDHVVTINWKGTADLLLEQDPDVVHRFACPVPPQVLDELLAKLPDFRRGWEPTALRVEEVRGVRPRGAVPRHVPQELERHAGQDPGGARRLSGSRPLPVTLGLNPSLSLLFPAAYLSD